MRIACFSHCLSEVKGGNATALFNELLLLLLWCPIKIRFLFSWTLSFRKCQPNITQPKRTPRLPWLLGCPMYPEWGQNKIQGPRHTSWLENWALSKASLQILEAKPVLRALPSLVLFLHFPKPVVATSIYVFEKSLSASKVLCKYPLMFCCNVCIEITSCKGFTDVNIFWINYQAKANNFPALLYINITN